RKSVDPDRQHQCVDDVADDEQTDVAGPTSGDLDRLPLQRANALEQNERNRCSHENELVENLEFLGHRLRVLMRRPERADRRAGVESTRDGALRPACRPRRTTGRSLAAAAVTGAGIGIPVLAKSPTTAASCA